MPNILVEAMVVATLAMAAVATPGMVVATLVGVAATRAEAVVTLAEVEAIPAVVVVIQAVVVVVAEEEGTVGLAVAMGHIWEVVEGAAIMLVKLLLHKLMITLTIETM